MDNFPWTVKTEVTDGWGGDQISRSIVDKNGESVCHLNGITKEETKVLQAALKFYFENNKEIPDVFG